MLLVVNTNCNPYSNNSFPLRRQAQIYYLTEIDKELEYDPYIGEVIQVTNKWTGETCLALTAYTDSRELNEKHSKYGLCHHPKPRVASSLGLP